MDLPEVESFISFNEENIDEYYIREILKEDTDEEKNKIALAVYSNSNFRFVLNWFKRK